MKKTVVIIDEQALMLEIVEAILSESKDILLQQKFRSFAKGSSYLKKSGSDVLMIDLFQCVEELDTLLWIKEQFPEMKIILFTFCKDQSLILRALNMGLDGYVAKDSGYEHIERSIQSVCEGEEYFFPPISDLMKEDMENMKQILSNSQKANGLTKREREVMSLIAKGCSNLQIAENLNISDKTVKNHVSSLLRKMNFNDRTQAAVFFLNHRKG